MSDWPAGAYDVTALLPVHYGKASRLSIKCGRCGWHDVAKLTEEQLTVRLRDHWQATHEDMRRA